MKAIDFDLSDKWDIHIHGMRIAIGQPPCGAISHDDALLLAAHIVAKLGKENRFRQIYNAVKES